MKRNGSFKVRIELNTSSQKKGKNGRKTKTDNYPDPCFAIKYTSNTNGREVTLVRDAKAKLLFNVGYFLSPASVDHLCIACRRHKIPHQLLPIKSTVENLLPRILHI
jgi:hypothetical protein